MAPREGDWDRALVRVSSGPGQVLFSDLNASQVSAAELLLRPRAAERQGLGSSFAV